jgi:hypothetical protein
MIRAIAAVTLLLMLGGCLSTGAILIRAAVIIGGEGLKHAVGNDPNATTVEPHDDTPVIVQNDTRH